MVTTIPVSLLTIYPGLYHSFLPQGFIYLIRHFLQFGMQQRVFGGLYGVVGGIGQQAHGYKVLVVFAGIVAAHLHYLVIGHLYRLAHQPFFFRLHAYAVAAPAQPHVYGHQVLGHGLLGCKGLCPVCAFHNKPLLEEQEGDNAYRYSRVGNIEYRLEKINAVRVFARFDDGEVQHIHHLALQELAIAMAPLRKVGQRCVALVLGHSAQRIVGAAETGIGAVGKYKPVKHAVYQVAQRACQYQRAAYYGPFCIPPAHYAVQQEEAEYHGYKAESRQDELACSRVAQLHPIGHAFILYKVQAEPGAGHFEAVAIAEVRLDKYFQRLVGNDHQQDDQYGVTVLQWSGKLRMSKCVNAANILQIN